MKRIHWIGIGIAVVVAVAAFCFYFGPSGDEEPSSSKPVLTVDKKRSALLTQKGAPKSAVKPIESILMAERTVTNRTGRVMRARLRGRIGGSDDDVFRDENGKAYPPKDQELMRQARDAIDNDDLESARALAEQAMLSSNVEFRGMVVEALSWFGKDSLVELTQFMADENKEVADAAKSGWMGALQEIDDDGMKAGVVEATMQSLRDSDMLEDIANELVGIDELVALQVLVNVIEDGKNASAIPAAKESYNTITGEDWSGVDAAEAWLQENYEPDDDD